MKALFNKIKNWFKSDELLRVDYIDNVVKMDISDIAYIQLIEYDFEQPTENENINCVYVSVNTGGAAFYYQIGFIDWNTQIVTLKSDMVGSTDRSDVAFKFDSFDYDKFYRSTIEIFINRI